MITAKSQPDDCCCCVSVFSLLVQTHSTSAGLTATVRCHQFDASTVTGSHWYVSPWAEKVCSPPFCRKTRLTETDRPHELIHSPQLEHRHYPTEIIQHKHTAHIVCLSLQSWSISSPIFSSLPLSQLIFLPWHFLHYCLLSILNLHSPLMYQNIDAGAMVFIILWAARWTPAKRTLLISAVTQRLHTHTTSTHVVYTHVHTDLNQKQWEIIIDFGEN